MTAPNPLVAERQDSMTAISGIGLAESAVDLHNGISSGSWSEIALGGAGAVLETAGLVIDPIGTLVAAGISWLIEHVKPLTDALDWLAGDPDTIASYAQTWRNVSGAVNGARDSFNSAVAQQTAQWTGAAADAYRAKAGQQTEQLTAAATASDTVGSVVEIVGVLVGVVRELVRDLVAECIATLVARVPQWLAEAGLTLGLATPHVVASAVALIGRWVRRIADVVQKLVRSINNLQPLLRRLDEIWEALRSGFRRAPGGPDAPSPTGPTSPTAPSAATSPTPDTPTTNTGPASTSPASTGTAGSVTSPSPSTGSPDAPSSTTPTSAGTTGTVDTPTTTTPSSVDTPVNARDGGWGGAGWVYEHDSTPRARADYDRIRNTPDDVPRIAQNTGLDPSVIERAKQNLFVNEHDVPYGPNTVERGRFTPNEAYSELWDKATNGTLTQAEAQQFRSLVAHEYVESRLMELGMPYKSSHPAAWQLEDDGSWTSLFDPQHFGAHEVAPAGWGEVSLRHWRALGLEPPSTPIAEDLSNLDDVVDAARRGLNL